MPTKEVCRDLISTGVGNDLADVFTDLIPDLGLFSNKISEKIEIDTEGMLTPEEFKQDREMYELPDGLRAIILCMKNSRQKK